MDKFGDFVESMLFLLFGTCLLAILGGLTALIWLIVIRAITHG